MDYREGSSFLVSSFDVLPINIAANRLINVTANRSQRSANRKRKLRRGCKSFQVTKSFSLFRSSGTRITMYTLDFVKVNYWK